MYRLMIILSLVAGLSTAAFLQYRKKVPGQIILLSLMLNLTLIIQGALFVTMVLYSGKIGLNSTGGAMGMILGVFIFSLITPQYKKAFLESYITVLPLIYGIGKIGCSFAGCCYGTSYHGPLALIDDEGVSRFPIQPMEAIVFILAFIIAMILDSKGHLNPLLAAVAFAGLKIVLDFLRDTHTGLTLTANQIMCLFIIAFCLTTLAITTVTQKSSP